MEKQQGKRGGRKPARREKPEFEQKMLDLARVTRVVKGGRRFRFRATLVIGNRKGRVGVGVAKGADVSDAIQKAFNDAKKSMVSITLVNGTIAHDVLAKYGSAKVMLKPGKEGRGLIAGGAVRAVADLLGVRDIVSKSLGSSNALNLARATITALQMLKNNNTAAAPAVAEAKPAVVEKATPVKKAEETPKVAEPVKAVK